ncbi:MAG: 30S ribosomal protein S9 [Candidatus Thermoplasmatota archaeon]|jgi:small subunit ribosomal protein S9|nr:30S ribosomal protein S9 [Candidatus Thermoplasmatota archaeon]MDP7264999.1 30S ribosomal protein S9 [Candidatus Thermoplasmatota archaeon]
MAKKKAKVVNTSGKRKTSIARCTIKAGKGIFRINGVPFEFYEPELAKIKVRDALRFVLNRMDKIDISIKVMGGGILGRSDAIRTALARGLVEYFDDEELRQSFLSHDRSLLVSDTRRKEPKHPLGKGARAKRQKSYR